MTMIASTSIDSTIEFNDRVHHSNLSEQHFHISVLTFLLIQLQGSSRQFIGETLPYIRVGILIIIVSRPLGFLPEKDLLKQIFYDFSDAATVDLLRPSPEEAFVIQNQ
jgi:hypothetical protein